MSKPTLTIDSKPTILKRTSLDVNQITLTVEQLTVSMNKVYESSYNRYYNFHWFDLYSVAFSVSATLFLTCLTAEFKDYSNALRWLNPERMMFLAWIIFFLLFVFGIICVCRKANKNDDVFVDRDGTVMREINKLQSKKEEGM